MSDKKYIKALDIKEMEHIEPGHTINMPLQKNGAVWVRASEFNYEVGVAYHAKDSQSKGAGRFNKDGAFIWGDGTMTWPESRDDLMLLDESGQSKQRDKIDRDWITGALVQFALLYHQSKNKDVANDAAEYLNDKLKDAGIEYALSVDERQAAPLAQSRADLIREANGRDLGGVEGNKEREVGTVVNPVDFANWLLRYDFEAKYTKDGKVWICNRLYPDEQFTSEQLYKKFNGW
jgi:hypothetical protein